ncbi:MAG: hypothetical protein P8O19_05090 [Woeseiaceae bacterium]|jgi:hypothetical protein|nr:hypothetical protein [Woeseiaceae bacterium]MDG1016221.1 hypothetical protein [Woeseiaceae bacterium]MDG1712697.1 hypothetical protein [Woeseiaceae bacterium]MDG1866027.1 hypothetical protein [Woeseiaceae bacterium]|tara:strand:+ start:6570 stop:7166 length:597 start_codon:yes stop_codon:yes gene_type:complete
MKIVKLLRETIDKSNKLLLLCIIILPHSILSQIMDDDADLFASKANGPTLMLDSTPYKIVSNSRVNISGLFNLNDQNIIWSSQLGNYDVIVESIPNRTSKKEANISSIEAYQLAYSEETKKIVIVTGNIIVHLKNSSDSMGIEQDYNLKLVNNFPRINRAFFRLNNQDELAQKIQQLTSDIRINDAYFEMIENFQRAQ